MSNLHFESLETDAKRAEQLRRECEEAFAAITRGLARVPDLTRPLLRVDLFVELDLSFNARVVLRPDCGRAEIEVNDGLLQGLYHALDVNAEPLMLAVLWPIEERDEQPFLPPDQVLTTLYELALHFVLHHEIFHLLCGHLELGPGVAEGGRTRFMSERDHPLSSRKSPLPGKERLRAYYLELEADALAMEWILDRLSFSSIETSLADLGSETEGNEAPVRTLSDLRGWKRVIGYRFLVTAVWVTIALFEANRSRRSNSADDHPFPSARLIASIKTAMGWFCEIDNLRISEQGELLWRPHQEDMKAVSEFWRGVMQPIVHSLQHFPDRATARVLALPTDHGRGDAVTALLHDITDLLARREPRGQGARQLRQVEALRFEMARDLGGLRYLEGLRTGMTGRERPS